MSAVHGFFICFMTFVLLIFNDGLQPEDSETLAQQMQDDKLPRVTTPAVPAAAASAYAKNRKLMANGLCTNRDISISQSKDSSSGIPQYIVQIVNTCMSGCAPSNIHLHCGWFASAKIVNPNTFKRVSYDDCLVNKGRPLMSSQIIRFTYSNSFMYPLVFKSARFC